MIKFADRDQAGKLRWSAALSRGWAFLMVLGAIGAAYYASDHDYPWWCGVIIGFATLSAIHHTSRSGALLATSITVTTLQKLEEEL